nr:caspase family protein [Streptomyces sp. KL118A]
MATSMYADASLSRLRAPADDAQAMMDVLGADDIGAFEARAVIDEPRERVMEVIEDVLHQCTRRDDVLVYLSCHGVLGPHAELYFATRDTVTDRLGTTAIEARWLLDRLDECRARRQVLILDCCFSGAYDRRVKAADDVQVVARFTEGRGRAVLTASRSTEFSSEGQEIAGAAMPGSRYTHALVEGIRTGGADTDGDGWITVVDAHEYAAARLADEHVPQHPELSLYRVEGSILLARCPPGARSAGQAKASAEPPGPSRWARARVRARARARAARWRRRVRAHWVITAVAAACLVGAIVTGVVLSAPGSGSGDGAGGKSGKSSGNGTADTEVLATEAVAFSPDGKLLAATRHGASGDALTPNTSIRLLSTATGKTVRTLRTGDHDPESLAFGPDGGTLASGGGNGTVRLWGPATGAVRHRLTGHEWVNAVAFSPDGRMLASGGGDAVVRLWNPRTGELLRTFVAHDSGVADVAFSPDGGLLATAGAAVDPGGDMSVRLWSPASGRPVRTVKTGKENFWQLAFSPGGTALAGAGADGEVRLWNPRTGRVIRTLDDTDLVDTDFGDTDHFAVSVAFSPDGGLLASGGFDGEVLLWDPAKGKPLSVLVGHKSAVNDLAFDPATRRLATAADDKTVRLWDVETGRLLRTW